MAAAEAEAEAAAQESLVKATDEEHAALSEYTDYVEGLRKGGGEEEEAGAREAVQRASAAYYRGGGRQACGGNVQCLQLYRLLSRKEQAHARFVERYLALRENRPYREPAWGEDDTYQQNVERNSQLTQDAVRGTVRAVQERYGDGGELPEDRGTPEQRVAARDANDWYRTLKALAFAGGLAIGAAALVDAVQTAEMRNSYCSVAAWDKPGGAVTRLDCSDAVGSDAGRYATLQAECTCLGPVPQPCGGPACSVLQRCSGLPGFEPTGQHSCAKKYNYSFTQCSVWCGMSAVLHSLEKAVEPANWVRDLLIGAGLLFVAVLLIAAFMR